MRLECVDSMTATARDRDHDQFNDRAAVASQKKQTLGRPDYRIAKTYSRDKTIGVQVPGPHLHPSSNPNSKVAMQVSSQPTDPEVTYLLIGLFHRRLWWLSTSSCGPHPHSPQCTHVGTMILLELRRPCRRPSAGTGPSHAMRACLQLRLSVQSPTAGIRRFRALCSASIGRSFLRVPEFRFRRFCLREKLRMRSPDHPEASGNQHFLPYTGSICNKVYFQFSFFFLSFFFLFCIAKIGRSSADSLPPASGSGTLSFTVTCPRLSCP
jgi:hypothetical protein